MCSTDSSDFASFIPVIASVLTHLTQRNKEITVTSEKLKVFHSLKVPPIGIGDYLQRIVKYAYCSSECFIFALIYLDRLITQNKNCHITLYNVHRLLITSVLLAAKARDDTYYSNAYYSAIGGISNAEMNKLEISFLLLVEFNLFVTPETYEQYKTYLLQHSTAGSPKHGERVNSISSSYSSVVAHPQTQTGSSESVVVMNKKALTQGVTYMDVETEEEQTSEMANGRDYCLPGELPVTSA